MDSELSFYAKLLGTPVEIRKFSHILVNETKLTYKTEPDNCIGQLKNICLNEASWLLERLNSDDVFIESVKEQLLLKESLPNKRQYSPKLYSLAFSSYSASMWVKWRKPAYLWLTKFTVEKLAASANGQILSEENEKSDRSCVRS